MPTRQWVQRILWIDGLAALSAGGFVLVFRELLAEFYALPVTFTTFVGLVNVGYSTFGLTLAAWKQRRLGAVMALSIANGLWACVCIFLILQFRHEASVLGLAHILFEGLFVAALASVEWRHRRALARHAPPRQCHATLYQG